MEQSKCGFNPFMPEFILDSIKKLFLKCFISVNGDANLF